LVQTSVSRGVPNLPGPLFIDRIFLISFSVEGS
jgi:hypothetical protein